MAIAAAVRTATAKLHNADVNLFQGGNGLENKELFAGIEPRKSLRLGHCDFFGWMLYRRA